jgi:hypothetical protein
MSSNTNTNTNTNMNVNVNVKGALHKTPFFKCTRSHSEELPGGDIHRKPQPLQRCLPVYASESSGCQAELILPAAENVPPPPPSESVVMMSHCAATGDCGPPYAIHDAKPLSDPQLLDDPVLLSIPQCQPH